MNEASFSQSQSRYYTIHRLLHNGLKNFLAVGILFVERGHHCGDRITDCLSLINHRVCFDKKKDGNMQTYVLIIIVKFTFKIAKSFTG